MRTSREMAEQFEFIAAAPRKQDSSVRPRGGNQQPQQIPALSNFDQPRRRAGCTLKAITATLHLRGPNGPLSFFGTLGPRPRLRHVGDIKEGQEDAGK
jgi:hypothetical protein